MSDLVQKMNPLAKCQRCEKEVSTNKCPTVSFKGKTMYFCENCFKSVFKYDESLHTVPQIYEENSRQVPFTIRSSNWHRSSFMVVNEAKREEGKNGSSKVVFVGDFYLRGVLKEQGHVVGKSTHFIWTKWSAELAEKYKEPLQEEASEPAS